MLNYNTNHIIINICTKKKKRITDRDSAFKSLKNIFNKIISSPNELKHRDLNYNTLCNKFLKLNCKSYCIDLLLHIGFEKCVNDKNEYRLIFKQKI